LNKALSGWKPYYLVLLISLNCNEFIPINFPIQNKSVNQLLMSFMNYFNLNRN